MKGCNEKTMKKSAVKAVRLRVILNFPNWLYLALLYLTCTLTSNSLGVIRKLKSPKNFPCGELKANCGISEEFFWY